MLGLIYNVEKLLKPFYGVKVLIYFYMYVAGDSENPHFT